MVALARRLRWPAAAFGRFQAVLLSDFFTVILSCFHAVSCAGMFTAVFHAVFHVGFTYGWFYVLSHSDFYLRLFHTLAFTGIAYG